MAQQMPHFPLHLWILSGTTRVSRYQKGKTFLKVLILRMTHDTSVRLDAVQPLVKTLCSPVLTGASSSTLCNVIDDVVDYEVDSQSAGSGSDQFAAARPGDPPGGAGVPPATAGTVKPPPPSAMTPAGAGTDPALRTRRKRRFDAALPAAHDVRTPPLRRAKMQRYRFERRTHRKVLHVSPSAAAAAHDYRDTQSAGHCHVSPCQVQAVRGWDEMGAEPPPWL